MRQRLSKCLVIDATGQAVADGWFSCSTLLIVHGRTTQAAGDRKAGRRQVFSGLGTGIYQFERDLSSLCLGYLKVRSSYEQAVLGSLVATVWGYCDG